MKKNITEDLLIRYILGEADSLEVQEIKTWIAASEINARQFEQTKFILDTSRRMAQTSPADENKAWEKFKVKRGDRVPVKPVAGYIKWMQMAAAVLVLIGVCWGSYELLNHNAAAPGELVNINTSGKVLTDTLPDGSIVHLNKNSGIAYHRNFKSNRVVKLIGEAFFDVVHDESAPFIVQVNGVTVKDIGTAFNINSKAGRIEVIVESGLVKVSKNTGSVELKAQEMVRIHPGDQELRKEKSSDLLYNYYRSHEFIANNTPLWRMIEMLNEAYDAHIEIEGKDLRNIPLTGTFKEESLNRILQVILLTTPEIHMQQKGQLIILKK